MYDKKSAVGRRNCDIDESQRTSADEGSGKTGRGRRKPRERRSGGRTLGRSVGLRWRPVAAGRSGAQTVRAFVPSFVRSFAFPAACALTPSPSGGRGVRGTLYSYPWCSAPSGSLFPRRCCCARRRCRRRRCVPCFQASPLVRASERASGRTGGRAGGSPPTTLQLYIRFLASSAFESQHFGKKVLSLKPAFRETRSFSSFGSQAWVVGKSAGCLRTCSCPRRLLIAPGVCMKLEYRPEGRTEYQSNVIPFREPESRENCIREVQTEMLRFLNASLSSFHSTVHNIGPDSKIVEKTSWVS